MAESFLVRYKRRVIISLLISAHLVGFVSSLDALMSTRTAPGTVAWIVTLNGDSGRGYYRKKPVRESAYFSFTMKLAAIACRHGF